TSVIGQVHGNLADKELAFLSRSFEELNSDSAVEHILVTLHHNPVKGNAGWMKDIGLNNRTEFWERLKWQDKLRCVLYGHVHQDLDFVHNGIRCLCTPSTCIQFKPDVVNFALDDINPGYRSMVLNADGSIDTQVHRVTGFSFEVDFS
ncbi:MAG: phosphodiesterase, partial [Pseudomonadales bacterium]